MLGGGGLAVLNIVARGGVTERTAHEMGEGAGCEDFWKKSHPGGRRGRYQGPEAGECLACFKASRGQVAGVGRSEGAWSRPLHGKPPEALSCGVTGSD